MTCIKRMKRLLITLTAAVSLIALTLVTATAHGSEGYAPDEYWQVKNPVEFTDLSSNRKAILPVGTILHVLWYKNAKSEENSLAYFELKDYTIGSLPWLELFKMEYLGEGIGLGPERPF